MATFEIADGKPDTTGGSRGLISVTRFMPRDMRIGRKRVTLGISPGVVLIMPVQDNVRALIGSDFVTVVRGMSLLTAGDASTDLIWESRHDEQQIPEVTVRLIEVSAVLSGAIALRDHLELPCALDYEATTQLKRLCERLSVAGDGLRLPGTWDVAYGLFLKADFVITLLAASRQLPKAALSTHEEARDLKFRRYLMENVGTRLSAPEVASHMGMSVKTLTRWTRKRFGAPPAQYFKELRLQKSLELVGDGGLTIESIAEQTGFPDRYYFSKEFKKRFGSAPAQLRDAMDRVPTVDMLSQAHEHFSRARFRRALAACERGREVTKSSTAREQLLYMQGRCLNALGDTAGAMDVWGSLRNTTYAHPAGVAQCRLLFTMGKHDEALQSLREMFAQAEESQKEELVRLWMDQVVSMLPERRTRLLRRHMVLRGDLFPHDLASMHLAVDVLRGLEENDEVLRQCAQIPHACFNALRRAGRLEEAIADYGNRDTFDAVTLLKSGWYEDAEAALKLHPDPELHADLLARTGRAAEAIRQYPEHSQLAYFVLGRFKELLARFDEASDVKIYALNALGRAKVLRDMGSDLPGDWINAQLCVRPENILESTLPSICQYHGRARLLIAIRALQNGQIVKAEAALAEIDGVRSPDLWWEDHSDFELFLSSVVRGLIHDMSELYADIEHILQHFKFKVRQTVWHDAAYLSGAITKDEYLAQPMRESIAARFAFLQAMAHDIRGEEGLAMEGYNPFAERITPLHSTGLLMQRFAQWRLQVPESK